MNRVVALAGNPNVGKSTVFNALTGLNQHTGNWPGKTVVNAQGVHIYHDIEYTFVDLPGTYSIMAHSKEEEVARDFLCFGNADAVVVVCDATCLERNLNLVLQILELRKEVVVCINLMDEAKNKGIVININKLSKILGTPVVGICARKKQGLTEMMDKVEDMIQNPPKKDFEKILYPQVIEEVVERLQDTLTSTEETISKRWIAVKILENDSTLVSNFESITDEVSVCECIESLENNHITSNQLKDGIVTGIVKRAEEISKEVITYTKEEYRKSDEKLDKILTSKLTGIPIMLVLLFVVFWLTMVGANYPSQILAKGLFWLQDRLLILFQFIHSPIWLTNMLILGVYRVLAWVVSVMLPPMAIFFPLFTLLEDFGYLPRIAYNLDHQFKKCCACGKQALCMAMGFGCNAAGVTGCRIIDSPRERLIAIITNNFVPCNGRFPTLIAIISMFFLGSLVGPIKSLVSALILVGVIMLGIFMTFLVSRILSKTILKGIPSSFALELPPYRKPQIGSVIVHSIFDRTLFVLGRAVMVAAPAGLIIWIIANVKIADISLLMYCADFLDPFAKLLGLDGVILLAFILGFPANEIVVPIIIMAYMATGSLVEFNSLSDLRTLLVSHGWTTVTAVSTMLFCLMHWPCSTTCLTIKKETKSLKWTVVSFLVPTVMGMLLCFVFTTIARIFIG